MFVIDYINACRSNGSIGSYISLGVFALIGLLAFSGLLLGIKRGFSQSVIRFFTVAASAAGSFFIVKWIMGAIVDYASKITDGGTRTLEEAIYAIDPEFESLFPDYLKLMFAEINSESIILILMMVVAIILLPLLLITIFQLLKGISHLIYSLLAGLTGAISYGKSVVSTILGAAIGLAQGLLIAAVFIFPISGLCHIAEEAKAPLLEDATTQNTYIENAYTMVIDDLADNPVFDLMDKFGGNSLYKDMMTVKVNDKEIYMPDECIGVVKLGTDIAHIATSGFDWKNPTEEQRQSLENIKMHVSEDELIATLTSDLMRGLAKTVQDKKLTLGLNGATDTLVNDVMTMFATSTKDTIEGDIDVTLDVYFIMCDRGLFTSFTNSEHLDMKSLLTDKDENGDTIANAIIKRLNQYDRAQPIVSSFTKISLTVMHGSGSFGEDADILYESVKGDISSALSHNKSDFDTEEEYREAVTSDVDKALAENNITLEEDVKQDMIDYIADNYGDYEGEITDAEINDALLSYYESYAKSQENANNGNGSAGDGNIDNGESSGDGEIPEDGEGEE